VVEVRDNGLGVPEAKRAELFRRFFRAHEDINSDIQGTGLGLSIVRDTVTSLGGRAWAEFGEDGTAFFFTMPNRRAEDETRATAPDTGLPAPAVIVSDDRTAKDSAR
jgi:signal transduction histidine kinase